MKAERFVFGIAIFLALGSVNGFAQGARLVIGQVYGAGGNSGAVYRQDFVEIFNRGSAEAVVDGWSLQYASAAGATWQKVDLAGRIAPGGRFLIRLSGGSNGAELPVPDASGSINLGASAGKVALVIDGTPLTGACPTGARIADLVGYGGAAVCFEGTAPAPASSSSRAIVRGSDGCSDSDDNAADFAAAAPNPRNSASPATPCSAEEDDQEEGWRYPAESESGGTKPGSVLIFPIYTSNPATNIAVNTRISLTNTDPASRVTVRLVLIDGANDAAVDGLLCLGPGQTSTFFASDLDPGVTGYITAAAVDPSSGCPVRANQLIGSAFVKLDGSRSASLPAFGVAALADLTCAQGPFEIAFDGKSYNRLPGELAAPAGEPDAIEPVLILIRPEGRIDAVTGTVFQVPNAPLDLSVPVGRSQMIAPLSAFLKRGPAWMRLRCADGGAVIGAIIGGSSGRNLHVLSPAPDAKLFLPAQAGAC